MKGSNLRRSLQGFADRVTRQQQRGDQPNILFLLTDQQRWDAMGCSGGWVETPSIDSIASDGVRFTNAYTNGPVCIPARLSLAIGRYPHQHRVWDNRKHTLSPKIPTWMEALRKAGYRTSVFGKVHLYPQSGDLRDQEYLLHAYGFDDAEEVAGARSSLASRSNLTQLWREAGVYKAFKRDMNERRDNKLWVARPSPLPFELYPDVYVGRKAVEYLQAYDHDQPWFCCVSFPGPHEPWDAPAEYASRYDPAAMPPPAKPIEHRSPELRGFLHKRLADAIPFEEGEVGAMRAAYAGNISLIDDQIANVLRTVEERGETERTLIVFASDHGEMNGDHGLIAKKTFLNGAVRIPLLIKLPADHEAPRGVVSDTLVEFMDIGATLVESGGAKLPRSSHAQSVLPVVRDPAREHRSDAVSGLRKEMMIATKEWKMAINRERTPYVLIDVMNDPHETTNLAGDPGYDDILKGLYKRLKRSNRRV